MRTDAPLYIKFALILYAIALIVMGLNALWEWMISQ
jgi:hypothetical protein